MRAGYAVLLGLCLTGCGGDAQVDLGRRDGAVPPSGGAPDAGVDNGGVRPPPNTPPEPPEPPPFEEPGCAPISSPPPRTECDPLAEDSGCPDGESCFPFVDYPSGPCEVERYGTLCEPSGSGIQGDSCALEPCSAEHICVSTGRGTQCARLCALNEDSGEVCAAGLLCLPIDIGGFGGCL